MSRELHIIGAGGHARVVAAAWIAAGGQVESFWDDAPERIQTLLDGDAVQGPVATLPAGSPAVIAIGSGEVRQRLSALQMDWQIVVHPRAWVAPHARLSPGAMVMAGAMVQPGAVIGSHAIVNTGASVDHDCQIGSYAHLAPGVRLAGNVIVEERAFLGVGVSVIPGCRIGAGAIVGAGAVVLRDIPPGVTVAGVPARVLQVP